MHPHFYTNRVRHRAENKQHLLSVYIKGRKQTSSFISLNKGVSVDRPKKNICVFTVTCQKNLGSVGQHYFFISIFFYYRQNRK